MRRLGRSSSPKEFKAARERNKALLIEAHRSGDWETAATLSQEKQQLKRTRICVDCGKATHGIRCKQHEMFNRWYARKIEI
jgi:hypothetical protein